MYHPEPPTKDQTSKHHQSRFRRGFRIENSPKDRSWFRKCHPLFETNFIHPGGNAFDNELIQKHLKNPYPQQLWTSRSPCVVFHGSLQGFGPRGKEQLINGIWIKVHLFPAFPRSFPMHPILKIRQRGCNMQNETWTNQNHLSKPLFLFNQFHET